MEEQKQDLNDFKRAAVSGVVWKFLERFIAQGVSLIVSIVIARILSPEDYGVVSLVTIFFTFANVLISGGLNTALIQKKDATAADYSSVLFVSLGLSVVIYLGLFFLAPVIADAYAEPSIVLIVRIMGISLPVTAIKSIWCAYIYSTFQFKKFFFATLGGTVVSGAVGIVLALKGFGAWALVAQQMTNTVLDTILLIVTTRMKITFKVSWERFANLFKYGWKILLSSLISTTYNEISPIVISIKFSKADLSFYTKGKSFPTLISTATTNTLSAVLFPFLSKVQDDKEKLLAYTRKYMQVASYISFPIMLGFFAVAGNFVDVVLTSKWAESVFYIRLFCLCSMFDVIAVGNCETIKAIGKSGTYLLMEIIKKSLYFLTILCFVFFSQTPQILAVSAIVCTAIQIVVNVIPNKKLIGYRYQYQFLDLFPNLVMGALMCGVVFLMGLIPMNRLLCLVLQVFVGAGLYFGMSVLTKNTSYQFIVNEVKKRIKHKRA